MQITLSELKTGTEKYITLAKRQDIYVTENGERITKITRTPKYKMGAAKALFGVLPRNADLDAARTERFSE